MNEIEKVQDFLLYNSEEGSVKVQAIVDAGTGTTWLRGKTMYLQELTDCSHK